MIDLNKNFLINGYGISGKSVEKYLKNKNCNYSIYDDFKKIRNKRVISKNYLEKKINQYSYFIVSPSIKIERKHFLYKYKKNFNRFRFSKFRNIFTENIGFDRNGGKILHL